MGTEWLEDPDSALTIEIASGPRGRLYAYRHPDGSSVLDALNKKLKKRYGVRFWRFANEGAETLKGDHYHNWANDDEMRDFSAFKDLDSKTRIPIFPEGRPGMFVATHLISGKNEDKLKTKDKLETLRVRAEYYERQARLREQLGRRAAGARGRSGRN